VVRSRGHARKRSLGNHESAVPIMPEVPPTVALVTDDLLLFSRLEPLIADAGATVLPVRSRAAVATLLDGDTPLQALVLDLSAKHLVPLDAIHRLRVLFPSAPILAFGPHTDRETLEEAARRGCATVLPRSRAVRDLTQELLGVLRRPASFG